MSSLIPEAPQILPRQPGESVYSYRNRRSIALTGETLYQRRQRTGRERGLSGRAAAGHRAVGGRTEYQIRYQRTMARYGLSPTQLYYLKVDQDLADNGYTPETTGLSQSKLRRLWPRLRWINDNTTGGGQITPEHFADISALVADGEVDRNFAYDHVNWRYEGMYEFKVLKNNMAGRYYWFSEGDLRGYLTGGDMTSPYAVWWFYH